MLLFFLAHESCDKHVNLSLLGWQTSDPAGGEMVNLSQIHINIHQASPLMFQLQVCIHFRLCTSLIWAVFIDWLVRRKDQGCVTDVSETNIPHGILQEFAVTEKSKSFKTSHLRNVSRSCTAPRFTTPRLSLEAAEVFSTRIMKGSLTLRSVISRSRMVQVFLTPSAFVLLSPTSTRLTESAHRLVVVRYF